MQVQIWRCLRRHIVMHVYKIQQNPGVKKGWPSAETSNPSKSQGLWFSHTLAQKCTLNTYKHLTCTVTTTCKMGIFKQMLKEVNEWVNIASIQSCKVWKWQCKGKACIIIKVFLVLFHVEVVPSACILKWNTKTDPQRLSHMVRNTPSLETSEAFNHLLLQRDLASGG